MGILFHIKPLLAVPRALYPNGPAGRRDVYSNDPSSIACCHTGNHLRAWFLT